MLIYRDRLATFASWPHASPTPKDLARAGFSYRPTSEDLDNVFCQICKQNLCDWQPADDPKIEHHILHPGCSILWISGSQKKPLPSDIGFFDPSLQYDFPELCLFQDVHVFCDRVKRLDHQEADILALLPKCLRGEALAWFRKSKKHQDLAVCIRDMIARFPPQQAPQIAPSQTAPQVISQSACQTPNYHHCKLCKASFSSMARLIRHSQNAICDKPACRHCEKVFLSKNQLHRHLREVCRKQVHRQSSLVSSPSPRTSPQILSPSPSPRSSPRILSPLPSYRAISPSPPTYAAIKDYLTIEDLFRMFGSSSASTKSSTTSSDDPFIRQFVSLANPHQWIHKQVRAGVYTRGIGNSHKLSPNYAGAMCSSPHRCGSPLLLNTDKGQLYQIWFSPIAKQVERHHFYY